jgi:nucleoside-triphosphatase
MVDLESVGVTAIVSAVENSDIVVIDEIGPMELFSRSFKEAVGKAAAHAKFVVGAVHRRTGDKVIASLKNREDAELFQVTVENRSSLWELIVERAIISLHSPSEG